MVDTKLIESMIKGLTKRADILKAIKGCEYEDLTAESGYLNIHIPTEDGGYVRIYRAYDRQMELVPDKGRVRVRKFTPVKFCWSGIPTFEPSGRRSF